MLPFRCMLAVLLVAAAAAQEVSFFNRPLQSFAPDSFHTDIKASRNIFLYTLNRQSNGECDRPESMRFPSYFKEKSVFGYLGGYDPKVSCFKQDGVKFAGATGSGHSAKAEAQGPEAKSFIKSTLSGDNASTSRDWGFGFELVWSEGPFGTAPFGVDPPPEDKSWWTSLFNFGPAMEAFIVREIGTNSVDIAFNLKSGNQVITLPTVEQGNLASFQPDKNQVNRVSVSIILRNEGNKLKYCVDVKHGSSTRSRALGTIDDVGVLSFFEEQNIYDLEIGGSTQLFDDSIGKNGFQRTRFRGHLHQIGLFGLSNADILKIQSGTPNVPDFHTESGNRRTAKTMPRPSGWQYVKIPVRAKGWQFPVVMTSRFEPAVDDQSMINYYDFDFDALGDTFTSVKVSAQGVSYNATSKNVVFDNIMDASYFTDWNKQDILSHYKPDDKDCTLSKHSKEPDVSLGDTADGSHVKVVLMVCLFDRRVKMEATMLMPTVPVLDSATPFARIELDDMEGFNYYVIINTTDFVHGSFGVVVESKSEDGAKCKYFEDKDILVLNEHQQIKLDKHEGPIDLCVNVYGFRNFNGKSIESAIVNVAVARYQHQASAETTTPADGALKVDLSKNWASTVHYTSDQVAAMVKEVDNQELNMHISEFQALNVNITSGLTACFRIKCKGLEVRENTINPTDTSIGNKNSVLLALSVTGSDMFLPSRQVISGHRFNITLPDPSQGTLYVFNVVGGSDSVSLERIELVGDNASITAYDEGVWEPDTVTSPRLEFVPAANYFNALVNADEEKRFGFNTTGDNGGYINGCTNTETGCPVEIRFTYDYEFNTTSPSYTSTPMSGTATVYVLGQDTLYTSDMLVMPAFGLEKPFKLAVNQPLAFTAATGLGIKLKHPDGDSEELFNVKLTSTSKTGYFFTPLDIGSGPGSVNVHTCKTANTSVAANANCNDCSFCLSGYPSAVEIFLSKVVWQSSTIESAVEFKLEVIEREGLAPASGSFFVDVVSKQKSADAIGLIVGATIGAVVVLLLGVGFVIYKTRMLGGTNFKYQNDVRAVGHTSPNTLGPKRVTMKSGNPSFMSPADRNV